MLPVVTFACNITISHSGPFLRVGHVKQQENSQHMYCKQELWAWRIWETLTRTKLWWLDEGIRAFPERIEKNHSERNLEATQCLVLLFFSETRWKDLMRRERGAVRFFSITEDSLTCQRWGMVNREHRCGEEARGTQTQLIFPHSVVITVW